MSDVIVSLFFLDADTDFIVWIKRCQEAQNGKYVCFQWSFNLKRSNRLTFFDLNRSVLTL